MLEAIKISQHIAYLPASVRPLSSDIGIVDGDAYVWIFDAGNNTETAAFLNMIKKPKVIILSHFHPDHIASLPMIRHQSVYLSEYTQKYTKENGDIIIIDKPITIHDGVSIRLFPLPSSHAKGCIGMEIDATYAFLGDAMYSTIREQHIAYNATTLLEEIKTLRNLSAPYFLVSHDPKFIRNKEDVVAELEEIYQMRHPQKPYILLQDAK